MHENQIKKNENATKETNVTCHLVKLKVTFKNKE
jgi:hypothetical protein